jgi:hypothetical protein
MNQDSQNQQEQQTKQGYQVRQVTHYQPSWQEKQRGEPGKFFVQLILDHGVEEYVLEPDVEDADVLLKLLAQGGYIGFDQDRKVLMFPNCPTK